MLNVYTCVLHNFRNLITAIIAIDGEVALSSGSQLTFGGHNLVQEPPSLKCERKLARAFTFSSESAAKISPVTQVKSGSIFLD